MHVLVYGGGAVGLGLGSCLIKAGARVDILSRADTVSCLRQEGLLRSGLFGQFHAASSLFGAYASLDEIGCAMYDVVLVCTKAYDSEHAARDLAAHSHLVGQAQIVLCQNGWGNAERFCVHFPKERIYNGRVITGFYRPQKNQTEVTVHADAIHLGSLFHTNPAVLEPLARAISEGDIPCQVSARIEQDLWAKMLYNCALNPVGAVFDVTYGTLGAYATTRAIMDAIVAEVWDVMRASGYLAHWETVAAYLAVFYEKLIPSTASHRSSMLQDIQARKRTEIDALNGAVVELGERHGVAVPCNQMIYNMVKFLEERNRPGTGTRAGKG
jgi:2-dehydropantoate 2-reductase